MLTRSAKMLHVASDECFTCCDARGWLWSCRIYDLYCDFVLKNPFYEVEMPVRCELFDQNLFATIGMLHRRWGVIQP